MEKILTKTMVMLPTNEFAIISYETDCHKLSKMFGCRITPDMLIHSDINGMAHLCHVIRTRGNKTFDYG